jgi:hypothetical protein
MTTQACGMNRPATIGARIREAVMAGRDLPSLDNQGPAILAECVGDRCQCGHKKVCGVGFCPRCNRALPAEVTNALGSSAGNNYLAMYAHALGILHAPLLAKRTKRRAARG